MTHDPLARYLQQRSYRTERRLRLRPMRTNEILDLASRAFQALGRPILKAAATPCLCCLAGFVFFWSYAFPSFWSTKNPGSTSAQIGEAMLALALGLFVAGPVFMMGTAYCSALTTHMVADFMVGNVPYVDAAKRSARSRLLSMLRLLFRQMFSAVASLLVSWGLLMVAALVADTQGAGMGWSALTAGLGTLGMVFGVLWIPISLIRDGLAPAAMAMEGLGAKDALKRSRKLLAAERRQQSGYEVLANGVILIGILYALGAWGLMALAAELGIGSFLADHLVGSGWSDLLTSVFAYIPWFLVLWVTIPLWSVICTILYFERRVRKEGFDIEVLAQDVWQSDKSRRFQL